MTDMPVSPVDGEPAIGTPSEPEWLGQAHQWVLDHWPTSLRRRIAIVLVAVAVGFVAIAWLAHVVGAAVDLGLLAYLGLMVVCWVGAGGALVPVPGVRPLSWIMIVHQGTVLSPPVVALLAALAMALGQTSYFVAVRTETRRHRDGSRLRLRHRLDRHPAEDGASAEPGHASPDASRRGRSNRLVLESRAQLERGRAAVQRRMKTHPQRIVFLLCVVPNPLTTFATASAAATGIPFPHFFAASFAGFLVLTVALVVAGQGILAALGMG